MQTDGLESQRDKFKQRIAAIAFEEDPLAVYVEFVQWTLDNFDDKDPHSGLSQLLDEATKKFKKDEAYKADLRYLKLWVLYANRVSQRSAIGIYSQLWKNGFGVSYSLLYEEYARMLEAAGRVEDADQVYRTGVKRHARPIERLKARYTDFRKRHGKKPVISQDISKTNTAAACSPKQLSSAASRYATMLAPPQPGKPPEKLRFDMTLLYTEKTGEFCFEEARTRSMGLLRKEWPVLPVESLAHSARSSSLTVLRPGEGRFGKRKSMLAGEPTVTINTREALEDVFGMYNSPERTIRMGSKHAPVKKIEPVAMPRMTTSPPTTLGDGIHKSAVFQPFVDENSDDIKPRKTNKPAFTPFVDLENKTPTHKSRSAFAEKEAAPHQNENLLQDSKKFTKRDNTSVESIFSQKVFIPESEIQPLPLREAHTEDHGQPRPKTILTHERAKSDHDVGKASHPVAFRPFVDPGPETSFKVFSRPSEGKSIFTPKLSTMKLSVPPAKQPTFTPYKDPAEDNIQIEPLTEKKRQSHVDYDEPEYDEEFDQGNTPHQQEQQEAIDLDQYPEEDDNDYSDDFIDEECQEDVVEPLREELGEMYDGQEVDYHDVPFGGRFGQFSVMTPITERTFEYTSTSHSTFNTPSILSKHAPVIEEEQDSQLEAAQLVPDGADEFEHEDEAGGLHDIHPLRLPSEASISTLTHSTSKLSLVDTLTLSSNFKPSNPCNPFDPPIFQALLSRLNADSQYYDLTGTYHNGYDELQKYAKKNRKTSSSSGGGDAVHPLTLNGQKFVVSEKLGEGGFGAVFKARDCGALSDCDSDFEDEDEMEGDEASMVALKVVKPRNIWEYHVLRRLHSALPPANRRSIVFPHALYAFRDESYLVLDYCPQGTLLDIVNTAESAGVSQQGACLDELLVMFFTIELLRLLEIMHDIGFIHGDLKIDNCLLRLEEVPGGPSSWSSAYRPSGEGGWSYKGLKVIDFGRTIDTRLFPANQQFIADRETDERDCIEIQQGKPWTFQTDYFGLAGIIYCMFFGKYIQASAIGSSTSPDGKVKFRLTTPLKRYWQTDLWERLFHLLLNPVDVRSDGHMPLSEELGSIRTDMEAWLQANCNRTTGTLKGLLKKVEMSCLR